MFKKLKKISILLTIIISVSIIGVGSANVYAYNNYNYNTVKCGLNEENGEYFLTGIPTTLPKVLKIVYVALQIAIPVILVILGSIDLFKSVAAGKDDEIKKNQQVFIKRLVVAIIVFFVFAIVRLVISFVGDDNSTKIIDCADCLLNNNCTKEK